MHSRLRSFAFAFSGLRYLIASEHNMWIHVTASVVVTIFAAVLGLSAIEWCWIVVAIGWVWTAEAFNTAVERLSDAVTHERDPRIGVVKDVAAAGVLIAAVGALMIGILIFAPHLLRLIGYNI